MRRIILATANAKYHHTSLALRSLKANLGAFEANTSIIEFTIQERALDIVERLLALEPQVIGLSVYIWNLELLTNVARLIKQIAPDARLILGGPEVSFPNVAPPIYEFADHIVLGEAEHLFEPLCAAIFEGASSAKVIRGPLPALDQVKYPTHLYSDDDIAHRTLYIEASRGCPFGCAFCLSALDKHIRRFDPERLEAALDELWDRGARQYKFIDRALNLAITPRLLDYFLPKKDNELFLHFELVPDRLPDEIFDRLIQFPPGSVQLEAGIQSVSEDVLQRINRKQNVTLALENIERLVAQSGVHIHSDLVAGLPGEDIDSLATGFDRLLATGVHEIQFGILKKLRGAPIAKFDESFGMVYNEMPPYDILYNDHIDWARMQHLKRFARYWDLTFNNGNFKRTAPLIWKNSSAFWSFLDYSDWLFETTGRTASIALNRLGDLLFAYLTDVKKLPHEEIANSIYEDFHGAGRRSLPHSVRDHTTIAPKALTAGPAKLPKRQARHNS